MRPYVRLVKGWLRGAARLTAERSFFFLLTPQQLVGPPPQRLVAKRHQPTVQGKVYEWLCHV